MSAFSKRIKGALWMAACGLIASAAAVGAHAADLHGTLRVAANGWIIQKFPVQAAADDFMKRHPDVKVQVIPNDDDTFVT